jgi:LysM repeat protein/mono/diheme cytochrome c family protein
LNTQKQIILIVALTFLFVGGCAAYTAIDLPIRAEDQQDWTRDQSLERGALLFANNCRTCHGNKGQGGVGPQLLNSEANFQDQDPLKLRQNRDILRRTLSCGRAGTLMPAWLNTNGGSLNAIQINHLVNFLSAPIETPEDGEATSHWWEEAEEFAHNLNSEVAVLVGGDTLVTIARSHGIGPKQLAEFNNVPVEGFIKKGTEIKIPPFKEDSNGYAYTVYKDNETITKIAESQFVGPIIIADLNNLDYEFTEKRGAATLQLQTPEGADIPGLAPGTKLKFPEGTTYTITAGDTLQSIAERHGVSASAISGPNREVFNGVANDEEIPFELRLDLPKLTAIVQEGQTLGTIAQLHDIEVADLQAANSSIAEDADLEPGTALVLPSGTQYVVQAGDTWELVAQMHATTAAELAQANGKTPNDPLKPDVVIQLPQIDAYTVQGQTLEEVAEGYGNVTADSLAAANEGVQPNSNLYIGTQLHLPDDAFGTAAPDAINPGTACVQYAIPQSVYENEFDPNATPVAEATQPPTVSTNVRVEAHANDWTVNANGQAQPPNQGVVLVARGTTIPFTSVTGLHNVTSNGQKQGNDINTGQTRDVTFNDAGQFEITCSYHPDMLATIFVQ